MNRSRPFVRALGIVFGLFLTFPAFAAESLDEIYAIADRKDFDTALKRLNQFLNEHPQDAQGRFLKGLILTETKQRDQAISLFQQLSKDFPELPEPYNNLAVLFAEQGQFEKAQEALNQAVKAHPNYATAHENLGDIHAKMASQAYARALKLNPGNNVLTGKLNKVKTLFTESADQTPPKQGQPKTQAMGKSPPVKTDPPPPKPAGPVEATPVKPLVTAQTETPVKQDPAPHADKEKEATAVDLSSPKANASGTEAIKSETPVKEGATATPRKTVPDSAKLADPKSVDEVKQVVLDWAGAWSAKKIDQYIDAYSDRFQPVTKNLKSREAWEKNRREVIGKAGDIHIHVSDLQITMLTEQRAQATFQQNYTAKNYRDRVKKTLSLEREGEVWKIVREYAANE
ncbi:MAG: tetratricopeptide repeat protein [Magnetococcales bacterium]|nr:tetratricopeptide repeat protein [Magnetococcales bacterium]MBF0261403.1 tetratricopeptide repeat protein [Magnetococcales bacterium]